MRKAFLEITSCMKCPHMRETNQYSSDSWDSMVDWVCVQHCSNTLSSGEQIKQGKEIAGAVEWHEESKVEIPEWCPISLESLREKKLKGILNDK